jgi:signal peptidase I
MDWLDFKEFVKDTLKYVIFVVAVIVIAVYVIGLQQIVGDSMNPTFKNNDVILIDKLTPSFVELKRGDVISFYFEESKYLIKRIIGLPGETLEIKDDKIYINGKAIKDYVKDVHTSDFSLSEYGYERIPDDMYFVLGDNRENSMDSRDYRVGLVKRENIVGKKLIRLWPLL